jgi:hypothetical protein
MIRCVRIVAGAMRNRCGSRTIATVEGRADERLSAAGLAVRDGIALLASL